MKPAKKVPSPANPSKGRVEAVCGSSAVLGALLPGVSVAEFVACELKASEAAPLLWLTSLAGKAAAMFLSDRGVVDVGPALLWSLRGAAEPVVSFFGFVVAGAGVVEPLEVPLVS
jgi:hypothetical protein